MAVSKWAGLCGLLLGIAIPQASGSARADGGGGDLPASGEPLAGPSQFDFLIGEWDAVSVRHDPTDPSRNQEYRGVWRARYLLGGAMVLDEYKRYASEGEELGGSATLRHYSERTGRWEMVFLDTHRPVTLTRFEAHWQDGEMKLEGEGPIGQFRGRFHDIRKSGFRWEGELSQDGGKTWQLALTIETRRRP